MQHNMIFLLCQSVIDLSGRGGEFNPLQLPLVPLNPQVFIDPSIVCSHILFFPRSCYACFSIYLPTTYIKVYFCETCFQACWLSNLNTEVVDSLQKMIYVKLLRRLLQIFLIWQKRSVAFPLTLLGICNSNHF